MKVLIDMPDEDVENVKYCYQAIFGDMYFKMMRAIRDGIRIPTNATNGDVIKAMFPNDSIDFLIVNMDRRDWLNSPYRRETE